MPTYLPQIEPNRTGSLHTWDIPFNDWMGIKLGVGMEDMVSTAVSRWSEDAFDDSPEMKPEVANKSFGIPGHLTFDAPVKVQTAMRKKERKERELRYTAFLNAASHDSLSWKAAAGTAAMMLGSVSHPLDLGLTFIPFIGEASKGAGVAKLGARAALNRGLLGTTADMASVAGLRRFPNLTAAVINGTLGNAVAEIPVGLQKWADQADYTVADSMANIALGGVTGGAFHGLGKVLGRLLKSVGAHLDRLDPATQREILMRNAADILNGREPSGHEAVRWSEEEIAREIRAKNVFDEGAVTVRAEEEAGPLPEMRQEANTEAALPAKQWLKAWSETKKYQAAVQTEDGKTFVAESHEKAYEKAEADKAGPVIKRGFFTQDGRFLTLLDVAREQSTVTKEQVTTERAKRIQAYVEREKVRHGLEVEGKIKDEIATRIRAQQEAGRMMDEKDIAAWSRAETPEPAHVEALKRDTQAIEAQMLKAAFSAAGATDVLYAKAFDALKAGKDTISGVKDPILKEAKAAFDAGTIKSAADIKKLIEDNAEKAVKERIAKIKEQAATDPETKAISEAINCVANGRTD